MKIVFFFLALVLVTVNGELLLRDDDTDEADERDDALSPFEVFEDIEDIEDIEDRAAKNKKRAKRPKRPKKQALPETMETSKALTREEMPWLRLKYLTEEILTNHTLPEK